MGYLDVDMLSGFMVVPKDMEATILRSIPLSCLFAFPIVPCKTLVWQSAKNFHLAIAKEVFEKLLYKS